MIRRIEKTETELLDRAARFERDFPAFYRDASQTWTCDEDEIRKFYYSCSELYGIFGKREDELVGLAHFETMNEWHRVVHLDSARGADKLLLLNGIRLVRDDIFKGNVKQVQTWVLRQNRPLQAMLQAIGFRHTGLEMRRGRSHGRTLQWLQMTVRGGNH